MQDFTSQLLRAYFARTDWHPYNSYLHLTSFSSSILLDFPIPSGLSFSISSTPSPSFYSSHRLRALPQLAGSLGYVFASTEEPILLIGGRPRGAWATAGAGVGSSTGATAGQDDMRLRDVLERYRIVSVPSRPQGRQIVGKDGKPQEKRDYFLYGCLHAPSARLDALYTTRVSPTWNAIVTACSFPPRAPPQILSSQPNAAAATSFGGSPGATNLQFTLQNDTGKWFNEFSYSVDDALWGFRTMHHFGPSQKVAPTIASDDETFLHDHQHLSHRSQHQPHHSPANLRTDEDSTASEVGGGLKGRFSVGAELFLSALEKSAGLSTGVRFTTLPEDEDSGADSESSSTPSQPPTTITATLNPMMGHLSTAYAARLGKDIAACSRFDFNVYSYESELTLGGEYWLRSSSTSSSSDEQQEQSNDLAGDPMSLHPVDLQARPLPSNVSLREKRPSNVPTVNIAPSANRAQSGTVPSSNPVDELASQIVTEESVRAAQRQVVSQDTAATAGPSTSAPSPSTPAPPNSQFPFDSSSGRGSSAPEQDAAETTSTKPSASASAIHVPAPLPTPSAPPTTSGLLKWSLNSNLLLSLLWQGRLRNCLVAVGIKADLNARADGDANGRRFQGGVGSVIRGIGLDIVWWSGGGGNEGRGKPVTFLPPEGSHRI